MQDASIERLAKIISEPQGGDKRRPTFHLHIGLEEGWFSLFLLATVVYSAIWSVQAAQWVDHLNILSLTTAFGLVGGVIAAKQQRLPRLPVHLIAIVLGLLLAFWQTAGADYAGSTTAFANAMHQWLVTAFSGATNEDDSIFLFFITALGFVLAYTSAWLVYRTRSPWLMITANAVVLLINLSNIDAGYIVFLVVFLMASLLLLLRFNLHESIRRWKRQGLRYADDLGWDVMQAGALISIGILIFSWLLPSDYTNAAAAQIWNSDSNPWVQIQNDWNRLISVGGPFNLANHGNFRDTLVLGGNPNLNNDVVFTVQSDNSSAGEYLETLSYETYDGRGWSNGQTYSVSLRANQSVPPEGALEHTAQQVITVVNPPGEQYPYLLGPSQIASTDQPAQVLVSNSTGSVITFLRKSGRLVAGEHYTVVSYISSADEKTLRTVPFPKDAPQLPTSHDTLPPVTYYDPNILGTYLQLPRSLDPNILTLAKHITANYPTMYDKAVALQDYLHNTFTYNVNIQLPPGEEGVSWFLFNSGRQGFCNYFATAMAIMARWLGMPARVVAGYTNGQFDANHTHRIIRGTDAHAWTQIYFAGYGWVNFEPSASFSTFNRPAPGQFPGGSSTVSPGGLGKPSGTKKPSRPEITDTGGNSPTTTSAQTQAQWGQRVGLTLGGVILLVLFSAILFSLWWRRLFRGYSLSAQLYGRLCLLANWAGITLERSQTPYESIHALTAAAPEEAVPLERLGDIYVRERWADPASAEHPRSTGEVGELPDLWKRLQPRFFLYVLRHPHFLRWLPARTWGLLSTLWTRWRAHRRFENED